MIKTSKAYLGDGVYAEYDGFAIELTTENGIEKTNSIVLEPEVITSFINYVNRIIEEQDKS